MRRLSFVAFLVMLFFFVIPAVALAQGGGTVVVDYLQVIAYMIMGVGVPLAVLILKQVYPGAPAWLKAIAAPVIVPGLMYLAALASSWLGVEINFQAIIDVITTTAPIGMGATVAYTIAKKKR